ncbi:hypothetical protein D7I46_09400 [Lactococcus allomyrinae]|uniref:Uncharacterized protein n=1 Tax=Lactococcus allomyrinae TaxID=2419773 RepID=A0A387BLM1_9LACT|nr:hypothetical protein D7I46_09400 [Lactococcus allomyrinae]
MENGETPVETAVDQDDEKVLEGEAMAKPEVAQSEISEPEIAQPEVAEPFISEPVIAEQVVTPPQDESYQDIPTMTLGQDKSQIRTKWNWGAFSLTMWFGIAHRAYLGLLILLGLIPWIGPIFAIVWMIIFGLNGERWALENPDNHYRDEEEFRKIMDGWNRAGLIAFIIGAVMIVLAILLLSLLIATVFNNLDYFQQQFNQNYHHFSY